MDHMELFIQIGVCSYFDKNLGFGAKIIRIFFYYNYLKKRHYF